ncbi:MAG: hypothetical protein K8R79_02395, partial [Calditrichales bacterium]|nr:hypothetical protein [Calditrichales bacterium]
TKNFNSQIKTADTDGGKAINSKQADAAVKGEVKPNLNNSSLLQDLQRYGKNHIKLDGNNHWQSALADKMGNNSTNSKRAAEKRNEIFEMKTIKNEAQELNVDLKPGRLNKVKKSVLDGRLRTSDFAGNKKVLETGVGNIQKNAPSMIEKNGFLEFGGKSLSAMQDLTLNTDEPLKQGVEIKQLDTGKIMHNWLANQPVESAAPGKFAPLISNVQRIIQMQYASNLGKQINANFKIDGSPLGEMEIKFNGDNHSGVVTVYVESESARSELQKLLPTINDGLVQKGIDLADIKIDLGSFARENSQGQKMNGNNRNPLTNKLQEDANEQITPAMTAKNYGYNTIEVLA